MSCDFCRGATLSAPCPICTDVKSYAQARAAEPTKRKARASRRAAAPRFQPAPAPVVQRVPACGKAHPVHVRVTCALHPKHMGNHLGGGLEWPDLPAPAPRAAPPPVVVRALSVPPVRKDGAAPQVVASDEATEPGAPEFTVLSRRMAARAAPAPVAPIKTFWSTVPDIYQPRLLELVRKASAEGDAFKLTHHVARLADMAKWEAREKELTAMDARAHLGKPSGVGTRSMVAITPADEYRRREIHAEAISELGFDPLAVTPAPLPNGADLLAEMLADLKVGP